MMEKNLMTVEFEGTIDPGGKIQVPEKAIRQLAAADNVKLRVRLSSNAIHSTLKENEVSEDEIEHIGKMQLESRDQVIMFLLSEGVLKNKSGFRRRGMRVHKRTR